jgi:hypothetical protein
VLDVYEIPAPKISVPSDGPQNTKVVIFSKIAVTVLIKFRLFVDAIFQVKLRRWYFEENNSQLNCIFNSQQ